MRHWSINHNVCQRGTCVLRCWLSCQHTLLQFPGSKGNRSTKEGPYALRHVSRESPQDYLRNSTNTPQRVERQLLSLLIPLSVVKMVCVLICQCSESFSGLRATLSYRIVDHCCDALCVYQSVSVSACSFRLTHQYLSFSYHPLLNFRSLLLTEQ